MGSSHVKKLKTLKDVTYKAAAQFPELRPFQITRNALTFSRIARGKRGLPPYLLMFTAEERGEGDLRVLAAEMDVIYRVIFARFHRDPTPFYRVADLSVLSSNHEGFGNVIVETLARGTAVVFTDCPSGPAEIPQNGRYGRLGPAGGTEALANAMSEALVSSHGRGALIPRSADFAPSIAAKRYLELLFPA